MKRLLICLALVICLLPLFAEVITPIANIQDSTTAYTNQTVTVLGTITVGVGKLSTTQCKAYIQDNSGRGIMIFDYSIINAYTQNFVRGNYVKITGKIKEYNGVTELTTPITNIELVDQGFPLPAVTLSIDQATNYQYYEGTYVKVSGNLTENPYVTGGGANLNIRDSQNKTITARVWDSTGINYSTLLSGYPLDAYGVVSPYNSKSQILPAYQEDIVIKFTDPIISNVTYLPVKPYLDEEIDISAKIVDYNGVIDTAKVFYKTATESTYREYGLVAGTNHTYSTTLPAFNTIATGEGEYIFYISATDNDGVVVNSGLQSIEVTKRRPIITNIHFTNSPEAGDSLYVQASITDSDGTVTSAKIIYSLNYNHSEHEIVMTSIGGNVFEGVIPGQKSGAIVNVQIWAQDNSGNESLEDAQSNGDPVRYVFPVKIHKAILKITPKVYNIYEGDQVEIGYFGQSGDKVIIRIYNAEGKLVCTPVNTILSLASGINFYTWNGKDKTAQLVDPGMYICHLEVTRVTDGNKKVDQAPIVIGMKLK